VPDYGSFCPIALGTDVLADRWTPLILRELILGNTRFNDIARGLPGISRSLLVQRLRHLERKGVVETWPSPTGRGNEYHLTPAGKGLEEVVMSLGRWAVEFAFDELDPHDIDPVTLTWWMHRRIDPDELPPSRVVLQIDHTAPQRLTLWMVLDRGEASVCVQHPGFDTDLLATTTTPALGELFSGRVSLDHALATGSLVLEGPPALQKGFRRWFLWSPFSEQTRTMITRLSAREPA
jgi:DNA-binding HxlR family transcriptional regulator